jgi:hypothetical protein
VCRRRHFLRFYIWSFNARLSPVQSDAQESKSPVLVHGPVDITILMEAQIERAHGLCVTGIVPISRMLRLRPKSPIAHQRASRLSPGDKCCDRHTIMNWNHSLIFRCFKTRSSGGDVNGDRTQHGKNLFYLSDLLVSRIEALFHSSRATSTRRFPSSETSSF